MTPLMDLTFMLLIVFIITVPILDYSTDVTPPDMTTSKQISDTSKSVLVTIDKNGRCSIAGIAVDFSRLEEALRAQAPGHEDGVILRADKHRPYDEIIAVMRAAKNANMKTALMTEEEAK